MFTIRCIRHGCDSQLRVQTLAQLDQLPNRWVCPICEDFQPQDDLDQLDRLTNPNTTQEHITHEG